MTPANLSALTVGSVTIRAHGGLYSLNDLHKASGNESRHQPALFVRLDTTQALIQEIQSTDSQSTAISTINGGRYRGTYACRELVIAYAAWISAQFHLKVIRVFLDTVAPSRPQADKMAATRPASAVQPPAYPRRASSVTPASTELAQRIDEASFIAAEIQRLVTRTLMKELMHEAATGFANWRNKRWLLHMAGDDQGVLSIPRLTELPANAQIHTPVLPTRRST